jgi:hypothetical protein
VTVFGPAKRYLIFALIGAGVVGGVSALYSSHFEVLWLVVPVTLALLPGLALSVAAVETVGSRRDARARYLTLIIPALMSYVSTTLTLVVLKQLGIASASDFPPWDPTHGLTFLSVIVGLVFGFDQFRRALGRPD